MGFDWGGLLKNVAPILGGMSKAGVDANAARDRNAILKEQMRLNRDRFATDAPDRRLSTSTRASILSNFKPTSVEWGGPGSGERGEVPKISGGLSDSIANLDPQTKALVQQILKDELAQQMRGGETGGGQDRAVDLGSDFGKSSTGDKIVGGASTAANLLGAVPNLGKGSGPWWKKLLGLGGPGRDAPSSAPGTGGSVSNPNLWDAQGRYTGGFTDTPMYDPITGTWSNDHELTGRPKDPFDPGGMYSGNHPGDNPDHVDYL